MVWHSETDKEGDRGARLLSQTLMWFTESIPWLSHVIKHPSASDSVKSRSHQHINTRVRRIIPDVDKCKNNMQTSDAKQTAASGTQE